MSEPRIPHDQSVNAVEEADLAVARPLVKAARTLPVRALGAASDLSDQEPLYAATASFALTGLAMRDLRAFRAGGEMLAAHLLATALRGIVKQTVDRTRPIAAAERKHYEMGEGERFESDFNSFPSGHTAGAVAVALAARRHYPAAGPAALSIAAVTSATQVVRSKHFVTDVVAGAAIGWAAAALIGLLVSRAEEI
jgi:membrane-associated phospholipid phosphatase